MESTKEKIDLTLESIPDEIRNDHPGFIKDYIKKTRPQYSKDEVNHFLAKCVYNGLGQSEKSKPWAELQLDVFKKYARLSYDITELFPWLESILSQEKQATINN